MENDRPAFQAPSCDGMLFSPMLFPGWLKSHDLSHLKILSYFLGVFKWCYLDEMCSMFTYIFRTGLYLNLHFFIVVQFCALVRSCLWGYTCNLNAVEESDWCISKRCFLYHKLAFTQVSLLWWVSPPSWKCKTIISFFMVSSLKLEHFSMETVMKTTR